ncbi:MAG: MCE family protein [Planctomycetota bacterium]|nr:MAG: MCE family protein [Planctomycetota bacterium]
MNEQAYKFGVGVVVVASLVIAVILVMFFGAAPNFFVDRYTVTIRFSAAPGVATDTPVRKNGVQIGRVKDFQLLDEGGVDVTLELDAQYKVRARELPRISAGSLITGDAVVEFVPPTTESLLARFDGLGGSPQDGQLDDNEMALANAYLKDGDFLSGGTVAPDPLDALAEMQSSFGTTLQAIERAGNEVSGLAGDMRRLIGGSDGQMQELAQRIEQTVANFNQTLDSVQSVFNDPNLKNAMETIAQKLPGLIDEADQVMTQAQDTLASFEDAGRAAEQTMQNVAQLTEPLGENGEQIVADAMRTLQNLDALLVDLRAAAGNISQLSARVNQGQGTLAKLIEDDQLYYSLVNTLQNVELLTRRLQPIVEDARIATDKIARDPARLIDLRGVISGRPVGGIK